MTYPNRTAELEHKVMRCSHILADIADQIQRFENNILPDELFFPQRLRDVVEELERVDS